jgi:hypothetical protein
MELDAFLKPGSQDFSIKALGDDEKTREIIQKLCAKRKLLEKTVGVLPSDSRAEQALELLRLKEDMLGFGISEVDYQVYLTKTTHEVI